MIMRNSLCRAACVLMLSASVATPALTKESGFYLGLNVGTAAADVQNEPTGFFVTSSNVTTDDDDIAWSLSAGYRFNPYVGIEFSFNDLGDVDVLESGQGQ